MSNSLENISIIEKGNLSGEFYFQSLLEQGYAKGLFTDSDIERIQYDFLAFLAHKVELFNAGDSSSIRVEKAQDIMASNMFTIGLWLKTYQNPDDAITAIQNEQITGLYQKGRKRIDTMVAATNATHVKILEQLVDTKNVFYQATIVDGIKGFFKLYYPDFGAHEIHITADYPIYNTMPKLAGIEFIHAYLNAIYYENRFCRNFTTDDIHHLLCGYEEDYQELLINIYEPILTAALGCVLAGTDARRLDISEDGVIYLNRFFTGKTKSEIQAALENAAHELKRVFNFPHELELYIQRSLPFIGDKIEIAMGKQSLDHIFYRPVYPEHKPKLYFSFGDKMDNEQYRKVVNEIAQCRLLQDKMEIIKNQIHSLADLEDLLLDADLTRQEIKDILYKLSLPEIAALSKKYSVISDTEALEYREKEQILRECLHDYVSALSQEQRELFIKTSAVITIEFAP
jgi:hypothetical protein